MNGRKTLAVFKTVVGNPNVDLILVFLSMNLFCPMEDFIDFIWRSQFYFQENIFFFCDTCSRILMTSITGQFEFYTDKEGLVLSSGKQETELWSYNFGFPLVNNAFLLSNFDVLHVHISSQLFVLRLYLTKFGSGMLLVFIGSALHFWQPAKRSQKAQNQKGLHCKIRLDHIPHFYTSLPCICYQHHQHWWYQFFPCDFMNCV